MYLCIWVYKQDIFITYILEGISVFFPISFCPTLMDCSIDDTWWGPSIVDSSEQNKRTYCRTLSVDFQYFFADGHATFSPEDHYTTDCFCNFPTL